MTEQRGELGSSLQKGPLCGAPAASRRWKRRCVPFIFMSEACACVYTCALRSAKCMCVCVWCILLIDVLTAQSSSSLSEEDEAACSDLWRAQKLQMSRSRTASGLWTSFPPTPSLCLFSVLYEREQTDIERSTRGEDFVFTYPNKYLLFLLNKWMNDLKQRRLNLAVEILKVSHAEPPDRLN